MHNVVLNWNASTTIGVISYNVYRSIINGSGYVIIGTTGGALTFIDATVASGTIYYYVVTAVSPNGESVFSNQASASIP
jgi:fibronectin type 3 domain-containing protein